MQQQPKILVLDNVDRQGVDILTQAGFAVDVMGKQREEELCERIGPYQALVVRSATKVTEPVIQKARNLKVIARAGVGVDNIDVAAATRAGILVVNSPGGNTIAATELTMALMLALVRQIPQAHTSLIQGQWLRKKFKGQELQGKTLGILGLGRIGTEVAKRAQAFKMRTIGYDPFVGKDQVNELGIELLPLDQVISQADVLTIHMPLTNDTRGLIDGDVISRMKPGSYLINTARGGIVDESALYKALKSGHLSGAALDVWENEPPEGSLLLELPNVVGTPHLGASTQEAQVGVAIDVARDVVRVLKGELAHNSVNLPTLPSDPTGRVSQWAGAVETAGRFVAQIVRSCRAISVEYAGQEPTLDTQLLTRFAVKGILDTILDEPVSYVNATLLAEERGIQVTASRLETHQPSTGQIKVIIGQEGQPAQSVTLQVNPLTGEPRILAIDGYDLDAPVSEYMLVITHRDQPGVIGQVGSIIGSHDVNIAFMQVGRKSRGGDAVMLLGIDTILPQQGIAELHNLAGVHEVFPVQLR